MNGRRSFWEGVVVGGTQAIVFVGLLLALTLLLGNILGNTQQKLLTQIAQASRAQVCVAALPLTADGRSEAAVNARCMIPNGIAPLDTNNDGTIEGVPTTSEASP
jgi:hypothetical protein